MKIRIFGFECELDHVVGAAVALIALASLSVKIAHDCKTPSDGDEHQLEPSGVASASTGGAVQIVEASLPKTATSAAPSAETTVHVEPRIAISQVRSARPPPLTRVAPSAPRGIPRTLERHTQTWEELKGDSPSAP